MSDIDPLILARMQFAANITFHILFPSITIALAWFLLFFKLRFNATHDSKWMDIYFFWTKAFALCFALGVVSGITMSFQFGTNWPGYMNKVGNIAGPLLAYEILSAFFLEASFLGIMLFGFKRVSSLFHNISTFLVAFGTTLSAFWIIALNSWMHTPAGFQMVNGQAHATNWLQIIFNPSMPYRLVHMLLASGLTASFFIAGISAYRWLKDDYRPAVMTSLRVGIFAAACLIPLQIVMGDQQGLNTLHYEPQKIAAMEGLWKTEIGAPLVAFALPNEKTETNDYAIEVPKLASLILTHHFEGEVKGIDAFPNDHPPVAPVFWAFRVMVGTGMLMLFVSWAAVFIILRRKTIIKPLAYVLVGMTFAGWLATVAGWYVTEVGRQPWLVFGLLRVADAASTVSAPMIGLTLAGYLVLYVALMTAFVTTLFYMARKACREKMGVEEVPTSSHEAIIKTIE